MWREWLARAIRVAVRCGGATLACVCVLSATEAAGQNAPEHGETEQRPASRFQGGLGLLAGVPVGGFANNVGGTGGFLAHFGTRLGDGPVIVGGEITYLQYGGESRQVPFSESIPDVAVTVQTTNELVLVHARARIQRREGPWRPYADGLLGLNTIATRTGLTGFGGPGPSTTNLRDSAPGYGVGVGAMFGHRTKLDLAVRFVAGPEANYLTPGALRREDGQLLMDIKRSRTDLTTFYVGVAW